MQRIPSSRALAITTISLGLILWTSPARAQTVSVSREIAFGGGGYVPASGFQDSPRIASNGDGFLAVWEDSRDSQRRQDDVFATRLTSSGAVLDSWGLPIATSAAGDAQPAVAAVGQDYVVVWTQQRPSTGLDIMARRVHTNGSMDSPVVVSARPTDEFQPAIAVNGSAILIVWRDGGTSDSDIYGIALDASALTSTNPSAAPISTRTGQQSLPQVSALGTQFFVVWQDVPSGSQSDVYGARVTPSAAVLDPSGVPISKGSAVEATPAIAPTGSGALVAWSDKRNGNFDIYGARLNTAGSVLDASGFKIAGSSGPEVEPAITRVGSREMIAWQSGTDEGVLAATLSAGGATTSAAVQVMAPRSASGSIGLAWNGARALIARGTWGVEASAYDVFGVLTRSDGTTLGPLFPLSTAATEQAPSSLAWNGKSYLAVWSEARNTSAYGTDLFARRITAGGKFIGSSPTRLVHMQRDDGSPTIASNGSDWFVTWVHVLSGSETEILGVRVTSDGVVRDKTPIIVRRLSGWLLERPTIAWGGGRFLVTWGESLSSDAGDGGEYLRGALVDASGAVRARRTISSTRDAYTPAAIAWNGASFAAVWTDCRNADCGYAGNSSDTDIYGARVTPGGTVGSNIKIAGGSSRQTFPAVAWDGHRFLAAWAEDNTTIVGIRLSATLHAIGSAFYISSGTGARNTPAISWIGSNFLVAWDDSRDASKGVDTNGARISSDGTVQDPNGFAIASSFENEPVSSIASGGSGRALVAYTRFVTGTRNATRAFFRVVTG